jgi:AcrR family transcriptional regulator
MTAKILDKEAKRLDILKAAVETFVEKGLEKASMRDVAARAGIGKGTIYEYFRSKQEIVSASCDYFYNMFRLDEDRFLFPQNHAIEKLHGMFAFFSEMFRPESGPFFRLMFHFWGEAIRFSEMENIVLQRIKAFYGDFRRVIAAVLRQGMEEGSFRPDLDADCQASLIIGAIDGIFFQAILHEDWELPRRLTETLWKMVIQGIARGGPAVSDKGDPNE